MFQRWSVLAETSLEAVIRNNAHVKIVDALVPFSLVFWLFRGDAVPW